MANETQEAPVKDRNAPKRESTSMSNNNSSIRRYVVIAFLLGGVIKTIVDNLVEGAVLKDNLMQYYAPGSKQVTKTIHNASDFENGWHDIHVFFGNSDLILGGREGRAQAQQDKIVRSLLHNKNNGYFLDLAAHDAVEMSNTKNLEFDHDWTGICMEGNPNYWRSLASRKCIVVGAVIGHDRMEKVKFAMNGVPGWEGIVKPGFDNDLSKGPLRKNAQAEEFYTVTLEEILYKFDAPTDIDYLSLDVEGAETYIMSTFPFDKYSIKLMTVERPKDDLIEIFHEQGYKKLCTLAQFGETLWAKESVIPSLDMSILEGRNCDLKVYDD